jgi:hypothetical protein
MKLKPYKSCLKQPAAAILGAAILSLTITGAAQSYVVNNTVADAFLASGPAGTDLSTNNYGGAGQLAIAPASSTKGEFDSVIMFNTAAAIASFNSTYGAGNWTITGFTLSLGSNNGGTQGAVPSTFFNSVNAGAFEMDWLSNDSWVEGTGTPQTPSNTGVNYDSISALLSGSDILGTFNYTPPGNNVYANYNLPLDGNLVTDAASGANVSLYFYATNGAVSYLFNSRTGPSTHPELTITVTPTPEPATLSLLAMSFGTPWFFARRNRKA